MNLWYYITERLLPFEWLNYDFMKNALLAAIIMAPMFGILSTMVVNNRMAFFSDSIGHSALTGIAIGSILGIGDPVWSMVLFSVAFSILIVLVKSANTASTDTVIGVFSSAALAVGLVILSRQGFNKFTGYLVGDLLGITPAEIALLAALLTCVAIFWLFMFNKLLAVSINQSLADSRGMNVLFIEIAFTVVVAIVVTLTIRWIGLLIINSLMVLPAAASRNISRDIRQYHLASVVIALVSTVTGLILSYYWDTATGATIVVVCVAFYVLSLLFRRNFS